ncbi:MULTISPECIES: ligase-associated DNA damage response exonuclease [unclassified Janthinobacterium]|uniref:ligase-associated DNA damage response exonuclease n=1 Tax=unclassified Janthinobacterium TaxID=2610881 RepID=UPI00034CC871|nr:MULTISPECIES: ligase-associated DNA damage response exonuclease [unclassified Janthinobacterium]MEC5161434.1 putative mRNA 3-end processing factor [Janthinobacterium sp. CG_S6]
MADLVVVRPQGLYCEAGQFYIDPWRPVERAVITHAHADHARVGHGHYLSAAAGVPVLRARLGPIHIDGLEYGVPLRHKDVTISLHPAGHVLGSAQVRIEHRGEVWVASGDYKIEADATCAGFEPVRCDTFITESTFGLPIYRWQPQREVYDDINDWWRKNAAEGRASVLFCYAFGKAQRILSGLDADIGPIVCHGAAQALTQVYRDCGVRLPPTRMVHELADRAALKRAIVIAPPSAAGSPWIKRFGDYSDAFASGWMLLRGARRRRGVDRGFVLSDHADWPGLMQAIEASGAQRVIVTHGSIPTMVRWLRQKGWQAGAFDTEYGDDEAAEAAEVADAGPAAATAAPPDGAADA